MAEKYMVMRSLVHSTGAGMTIPIKLLGNEQAAKDFLQEQEVSLAEMFGTWVCAKRTPKGFAVGPTVKGFLDELIQSTMVVGHIVVSMEEHNSNLALPSGGLLDAHGRPV